MALTLFADYCFNDLPTHVSKYENFHFLKEKYEKRLIFAKQNFTFQIESLSLQKDEFFLIDEVYLEHVESKQNQFKVKCSIIYDCKKYIVTLSQKDNDELETYDMFKKANDIFDSCLLISEKY